MDYIKNRLAEPSTLRGIVYLCGGLLGLNLEAADTDKIVEGTLVLAGLLGMLPDKTHG